MQIEIVKPLNPTEVFGNLKIGTMFRCLEVTNMLCVKTSAMEYVCPESIKPAPHPMVHSKAVVPAVKVQVYFS